MSYTEIIKFDKMGSHILEEEYKMPHKVLIPSGIY